MKPKRGVFFLPLECELSVKTNFRYETKLIHYYQSGKILSGYLCLWQWPSEGCFMSY